MRYYLDTNILVYLLIEKNDISHDVAKLLSDYSNSFYVSTISINELIYLYKTGKIKSKLHACIDKMLNELLQIGISIVPFNNTTHLSIYKNLLFADNHKDMNDHAIIAQAISDRIPLISSDTKFKEYTAQGLNFVYNKR